MSEYHGFRRSVPKPTSLGTARARELTKRPHPDPAWTSRFVAAMTRTSIGILSVDPIGLISFSCRARNNLACKDVGSSPISSRKTVPSLAAWSRPRGLTDQLAKSCLAGRHRAREVRVVFHSFVFYSRSGS